MHIDVHAHYHSREYVDLLRRIGGDEIDLSLARHGSSLQADLSVRLEAMTRAGIGTQILSASTLQPYVSNRANAIEAARLSNDSYADIVRNDPASFAAFAALPLPHIDAALEELRRATDQLGMLGVGITTSILGRSPTDPAFDPIWQELDRRGGALFIHPAGNACGSVPLVESSLRMPLGGTLEDTWCATQLIERGFHTLFPNVRVILSHLGGSLPFLLHRFERAATRWPAERERPSVAVRKYWYDSVNGGPAALRCACETLGADRLVLGTDYPYWNADALAWAVRYVEVSGLDEDVVEGILRGNAAQLFPGRFNSAETRT